MIAQSLSAAELQLRSGQEVFLNRVPSSNFQALIPSNGTLGYQSQMQPLQKSLQTNDNQNVETNIMSKNTLNILHHFEKQQQPSKDSRADNPNCNSIFKAETSNHYHEQHDQQRQGQSSKISGNNNQSNETTNFILTQPNVEDDKIKKQISSLTPRKSGATSIHQEFDYVTGDSMATPEKPTIDGRGSSGQHSSNYLIPCSYGKSMQKSQSESQLNSSPIHSLLRSDFIPGKTTLTQSKLGDQQTLLSSSSSSSKKQGIQQSQSTSAFQIQLNRIETDQNNKGSNNSSNRSSSLGTGSHVSNNGRSAAAATAVEQQATISNQQSNANKQLRGYSMYVRPMIVEQKTFFYQEQQPTSNSVIKSQGKSEQAGCQETHEPCLQQHSVGLNTSSHSASASKDLTSHSNSIITAYFRDSKVNNSTASTNSSLLAQSKNNEIAILTNSASKSSIQPQKESGNRIQYQSSSGRKIDAIIAGIAHSQQSMQSTSSSYQLNSSVNQQWSHVLPPQQQQPAQKQQQQQYNSQSKNTAVESSSIGCKLIPKICSLSREQQQKQVYQYHNDLNGSNHINKFKRTTPTTTKIINPQQTRLIPGRINSNLQIINGSYQQQQLKSSISHEIVSEQSSTHQICMTEADSVRQFTGSSGSQQQKPIQVIVDECVKRTNELFERVKLQNSMQKNSLGNSGIHLKDSGQQSQHLELSQKLQEQQQVLNNQIGMPNAQRGRKEVESNQQQQQLSNFQQTRSQSANSSLPLSMQFKILTADRSNIFTDKSPEIQQTIKTVDENVLTSKNTNLLHARASSSSSSLNLRRRRRDLIGNGLVFEGDIDESGYRNGFGQLKQESNGAVVYLGWWKQNVFDGEGVLENPRVEEFEGEFDYTDFNQINEVWLKYEGTFKFGRKHGYGTLLLSNGEKYAGNFETDSVSGQGIFIRKAGKPIIGDWKDNLFISKTRTIQED